jgi:hypothetical protein
MNLLIFAPLISCRNPCTVEIEQFAANCEAVRDLTACEIDVYDHFLYGRYALVRGQLLSSKL